jgi:hypothetical protein
MNIIVIPEKNMKTNMPREKEALKINDRKPNKKK